MRPSLRLGIVSSALVLFGSVVHAGDANVRKQVLDLNRVTGQDAVMEKIRQLLGDEKGTKSLVSKAAEIASEKDSPLHYNGAIILAQLAVEFNDLPAAEKLFRIGMKEGAKLQSSKKLLESYGGLIDAFYENKKFEDAARICKELIELKTDDGKPRIVMIAVATRFNEFDFIEDDSFDTAKRLRPAVHRLLIQAMSKQGKYDQALQLVEQMIKTNDHWMERQLKGWVLREAGKFEDAASIYEDIISRINKDTNLPAEDKEEYQERYRYTLSNIYVDMKKIDRASEQLLKLLELKPEEPGYNNDLGYIWADNDMKLDEAEKLIRKALDLDRQRRKSSKVDPADDRDNGAYLDSLGWVLFKKKQYKEAKDVLIKAVEDKRNQHIEIYDHLGDVHMALGEKEQAVAAWKRGLEHVGEGRREADRKAAVEKKLQMHGK